ncbi:protein CROWDED NUCLEI 2 isoform X2 [Magnolia sinica]|uniref:protein CROWDED NUCLEI 2 isoform X2 n=1 Tax=Magnolia sinica TaxID=86752 RepID=UPI00265B164D|nr:protein CROWDED NUCLEI 2 isoform X2 [Magnolia sinica]XP_058081921.1 protein CROWDED NUCLEI 2 isoform X2 [Magnolia sinica]
MSSSFGCGIDYSVDIEELLHMATTCWERLDSDVKALTDARLEDKKYIKELERELKNCSQEIEYLQDQLNLRNVEANCLGEHVHSLELKLVEAGKIHENVSCLTEELGKSDAQCLFLMRSLKHKEVELQNSISRIEKLEAEVSSIALESQCEIESMKLEQIALEQRYIEAKKFSEQAAQEKASMGALIDELQARFKDAQHTIDCLEKENKELHEKLVTSDRNNKILHKFKEHLEEWQKNSSKSVFYIPDISDQSFNLELEHMLSLLKQMCTCEEALDPFLSKLADVTAWDENLKDEMEKMMHQILESELLVKQLKEDLREEKSRAKEEAEDLTQEMAEMRYQITEILEQECKRRACIEQASLQRIAELEAQLRKEQQKLFIALSHLRESQKLAEARSTEVNHLKNALAGSSPSGNPPIFPQRAQVCSCGDCGISKNQLDCFDQVLIEAKGSEDICADFSLHPLAITWYSEESNIRLGED